MMISEKFSNSQGDLQQQLITLAPFLLAALADVASSGVVFRTDKIKTTSFVFTIRSVFYIHFTSLTIIAL